jgi:hypothetical protein
VGRDDTLPVEGRAQTTCQLGAKVAAKGGNTLFVTAFLDSCSVGMVFSPLIVI